MAKITSQSGLNVGTEITIDETAKTFTLIEAGNLVAKDGVTARALYSKFVSLWQTSTYQDSPFPMDAIDYISGQYQFGVSDGRYNGWKPADDTTRQMIRDGGWNEYSAAGVLNRVYAGAVGLGSVGSGAQLYHQLTSTGSPANFAFTDQCNQAIQVYGDASNGNFDNRTFFKVYCREYAKTYSESTLTDTGKAASGAYIVNFLISNADDPNIIANDAAMSGAPYSGITITYYGSDQNRTINGVSAPFRVIIDGNSATLEQIYTKVQYLLRQNSDIDSGAGTVTGKTASLLLDFLGTTLKTRTGVYIDNIQLADANRIIFTDQNGVERTNSYTSTGTLAFASPHVGAGSMYRMIYATTPAGDDYGEATAVTVNDASGNPITGTISSSSIAFTFDYTNNTQGGYTGGTDRSVKIIAVRPGYSVPTVIDGTINQAKGIVINVTATDELAYV
jgi:hypothetical protein